jgi:hypothetical protein
LRRRALESQTLIEMPYDPDTILVPSGENATEKIDLAAVRVRLLAQQLQFACQTQANRRQFCPRRGDFEGFGAPESQTLIVWSHDPDTILVPSGENATDSISLLCASVFSATKLMSVAIILRTREKYIERIRLHARFGSMEGCKLEGRMTCLGARAMCAPSGDAGVPAGHHGGKHLSGLDRVRVRGGTVCACSDRTDAR